MQQKRKNKHDPLEEHSTHLQHKQQSMKFEHCCSYVVYTICIGMASSLGCINQLEEVLHALLSMLLDDIMPLNFEGSRADLKNL